MSKASRAAATAVLVLLAARPASALDTARARPRSAGETIASIASRDAFRGSTFAVLATDLRTGREIAAYRPDALLAPASTTKLVSGAGALILLGAEYRFETRLVATGRMEGGHVPGDLVLVGSGDPNLSQRVRGDRLLFTDRDHTYAGFFDAERVPGDPLAVLRRMVRDAYEKGLRAVEGDIVADDGLFRETQDAFVGPVSAVCVNDNVVDIEVAPGPEPGTPARISWYPATRSVDIRNDVRTGRPGEPARLRVERRNGPAAFTVSGTIPKGDKPRLVVGRLEDPALAAAHYLKDLLLEAGVEVEGDCRRARFGPSVYRGMETLAVHRSPPFSEALRVILKVSHNLHATMLPIVVGAARGGRGDRGRGYALVRAHLLEQGVPTGTVVLESGSGGGRADRLSPRFLVALLRYMAGREDFPVFFDALPVAGMDGTLAERLRSPRLKGRVHAKTGTLVYRGWFNDRWLYISKALAGYLDLGGEGKREDLIAFAILIGNTVVADRGQGADLLFGAQEEILEAILRAAEEARTD